MNLFAWWRAKRAIARRLELYCRPDRRIGERRMSAEMCRDCGGSHIDPAKCQPRRSMA